MIYVILTSIISIAVSLFSLVPELKSFELAIFDFGVVEFVGLWTTCIALIFHLLFKNANELKRYEIFFFCESLIVGSITTYIVIFCSSFSSVSYFFVVAAVYSVKYAYLCSSFMNVDTKRVVLYALCMLTTVIPFLLIVLIITKITLKQFTITPQPYYPLFIRIISAINITWALDLAVNRQFYHISPSFGFDTGVVCLLVSIPSLIIFFLFYMYSEIVTVNDLPLFWYSGKFMMVIVFPFYPYSLFAFILLSIIDTARYLKRVRQINQAQ